MMLRSQIDNFTVFFTVVAVIAFYNIAIHAIYNAVLIVVVVIVHVVVRISVAVGLIINFLRCFRRYHNAPDSEDSPFKLLSLSVVFFLAIFQ